MVAGSGGVAPRRRNSSVVVVPLHYFTGRTVLDVRTLVFLVGVCCGDGF